MYEPTQPPQTSCNNFTCHHPHRAFPRVLLLGSTPTLRALPSHPQGPGRLLAPQTRAALQPHRHRHSPPCCGRRSSCGGARTRPLRCGRQNARCPPGLSWREGFHRGSPAGSGPGLVRVSTSCMPHAFRRLACTAPPRRAKGEGHAHSTPKPGRLSLDSSTSAALADGVPCTLRSPWAASTRSWKRFSSPVWRRTSFSSTQSSATWPPVFTLPTLAAATTSSDAASSARRRPDAVTWSGMAELSLPMREAEEVRMGL